MKPTLVIRRSPAYLALRITTLEIAFELCYLLLRTIAETVLANLGTSLPWFGPTLQISFLIIQVGLLVYLLARWANDTFELTDDEIVVRTGIAPRREVAYSYNNMQSITVTTSLLGRLLRAGQVSAYVPTLGQDIVFTEISNPTEFAAALKRALPFAGKNQFIVKR